ncbi:PspC domain-containing protein [Flavobacteriaceae bacterium]|nr:PspC domain-containing protein [Flavobacteriaceae bacterium]MDA9338818.1 PspC domain-containing protein [Flavobacteriaceae bacterium]
MKKTLTINIGYSIFNIDEDAYEILNKYLDSIKDYFQKIDNDPDIIKDFELRIAENFSSKVSSSKQCIDLSDVKEVIEIMGSLDDFKEIYNDTETENVKEEKKSNKLFRDSSNRIIAGVCSGIAEYFKIDPIIVRVLFFIAVPLNLIVYIIFWIGIPSKDFNPDLRKILYRDKENGVIGGVSKGLSNYLKIDANIIRVIFVLSLFFGGAGLLFYLLLWLFTKEAKTIGQKMNMSGFNVNLSNIEDFIKKKTKNLNSPENTLTKIFLFPFRLLAPLINAFLKIGVFVFKSIFFIFSSIFIVFTSVLLIVFSTISFKDISSEQDSEFYELLNALPDYFATFSVVFLLLTIIISVIISFYVLFKKKSNSYFFMVLIFLWIAFLILIMISLPNIILNMQELYLLPNWIDGNYSFIWKWDDGIMLNKNN